jgi:hypothetical protein
MPLDEVALRKPGWAEGNRVRLGDGQEWSFPRPRIRMVPRAGDDGRITAGVKAAASLGTEFEGWFDILMGVKESDALEEWEAKFGAAAKLLMLNYDLTVADLGDLLYWESGDPGSDARWFEIERAIRGVPPKERTPDI